MFPIKLFVSGNAAATAQNLLAPRGFPSRHRLRSDLRGRIYLSALGSLSVAESIPHFRRSLFRIGGAPRVSAARVYSFALIVALSHRTRHIRGYSSTATSDAFTDSPPRFPRLSRRRLGRRSSVPLLPVHRLDHPGFLCLTTGSDRTSADLLVLPVQLDLRAP